MPTLCRLSVFSDVVRKKGRKNVTVGVGWQDWNDSPRMERATARLHGSGSFYYPSPRAAWRRGRVLIQRGAQQVKVETISGREIGRLYARRAVAAGFHEQGCPYVPSNVTVLDGVVR